MFCGVALPVFFVDFGDVLINFTGKPCHKPLLFLRLNFTMKKGAFSTTPVEALR
jgi:hypothetical protein